MAVHTLSENHLRVLCVVARSIERSLDDIEELLSRKEEPSKLHYIQRSYSEEQRAGILQKVGSLRGRLAEFVRDFQLKGDSRSEQQILDTKVTHMWMLLEDSFSHKLKGYGRVDESVRDELDASVSELLRLLRALERVK